MKVNWRAAFAQLKMWPLSCSSAEIAKMTPAESMELWRQLNELREAFSGKHEKTPPPPRDVEEPASVEIMQEEVKTEELKGDPEGAQIIGGLGLGGYNCWSPTESEKRERAAGRNPDIDPFCIPRELAKDRTRALTLELCRSGMLEHFGVEKKNFEAATRFFEQTWRESDRIFELIKEAVQSPDEAWGRGVMVDLCKSGLVNSYGVAQDEEDKARGWLFDHLRECWKRHLETSDGV